MLTSSLVQNKCHLALIKLIWLMIGWHSSNSSMEQTKITPKKGMKGRPKKWKHGWRCILHLWNPPILAEPPIPDVDAPPTPGEIERRRAESEKLEEVGRSPESLPTWHLAQMAVEARPSMSGGEELARRKLQLTVGGKAPQKEFLRARKVKKPQGTG